jgi:L-lactate dehydrogenase complex protein LldF
MSTTARQFLDDAAQKAADLPHRVVIQKAIASYDAAVARGRARFAGPDGWPGWQTARSIAARIKWDAVNHLDRCLEQFERRVIENGGQVAWAETAADARDYIIGLAQRRGVRKVVKSKSMVTEEIHLNDALHAAGIHSVETDLGEFICQIRNEPPYHIVTPVMHLTKADIARDFHQKLGAPQTDNAEELTMIARQRLRREFLQADMGITGANFLVADTGMIAITENEGNARLSFSLPPIHVVVAGIEKVVPRLEDLALLWPLLATSGTGQHLTGYNSLVGGPRRDTEADGPREFHVVLLDNGRTRLLADAEQRDALHCIRCGACLNGCPIYRNVGGHAYHTTYQGPIGAVITPHLRGAEQWSHLSYASSLCGNCTDVCPVGIELHHHLLQNRRNAVARKLDHPLQRLAFRVWLWTMQNPRRYRLATALGRRALRSRLARPLLRPWTDTRAFAPPPSRSFRQWWSTQSRRDGP